MMYLINIENKLSEPAFQFINEPWMTMVRKKQFAGGIL